MYWELLAALLIAWTVVYVVIVFSDFTDDDEIYH